MYVISETERQRDGESKRLFGSTAVERLSEGARQQMSSHHELFSMLFVEKKTFCNPF